MGCADRWPGRMGKTSLAVRAAYDAATEFDKIVFVSLKSRELDDDGERDLSSFLISGLAELLNELARELGHSQIAKAPENERPRALLAALRGTRTLLVLDNLESLRKSERDTVFNFVKRLPPGCKAILTSRGRIGSAAEELILKKLSESAALDTLAKLAEINPVLGMTTEKERLDLYHETGGNPLLLRWTAGQIGRGSCVTLSDAISYLHSCPAGNDPLEFIFGDLVEDFNLAETHILCGLTYFTLPTNVEPLAELAECSNVEADHALRSLVNRSLVVPSDELKTFTLVPLVAEFLRKKKPDAVTETGGRLEKLAYALVIENGYQKHDRFPMLDAAWPTIAAALPHFLDPPSDRLQTVCSALYHFLNFTGRWDEWLALSLDAEKKAVGVKNFSSAGWRAYQAGWVYHVRGQSEQVLACADRAEAHWRESGPRERAFAIRLRGMGHESATNFPAAIKAFHEALELCRTLDRKSEDVAIILNSLASAEHLSGDVEAAERDFNDALRIAQAIEFHEGIASYTGNLAAVAMDRNDWPSAQTLASKALSLAEKLGRQELIATDCYRLAVALTRQDKKAEAFRYAHRAVEIFARLGSPFLAQARQALAECTS